MTPNQIAYYYLMLSAGFGQEYDEALESALASEDPLSPLTLALADCGSDLNKTLSILLEYALANPFETSVVQDMVMGQLQTLWELCQLDMKQLAVVLDCIGNRSADLYQIPWYDFSLPLDYYCLMEDGIIESSVFESWLYKFVLDREKTDIWKSHEKAAAKAVDRRSLAIRYLLGSILSGLVGLVFALALLAQIIKDGPDPFFTSDVWRIGFYILPILAFPIVTWHFYKEYRNNKDGKRN